MSNNNTNAQKTTFWKFLTDNTIEIPIIQRDYAQGRLGKEYLRKSFLTDLKDALDNALKEKEKTEMKLDFVYGSVENDKLSPLDGQQRLTTLWLLHWYVALMSGNLNENVCETLKKFTYETRISSREFCENLCKPENFNDYQGYVSTKGDRKVVEYITSRTWFYSAWKQDPTIQSMLRMLGGTEINDEKGNDIVDGLEEIFNCTNKETFDEYWKILTENNVIVFYQLPLKDFGLSDDLYIKMNARGKQLTEFENFKADLIGWMKDNGESFNPQDKSKFVDYNGRKMPYYMVFSNKIDNEWTNMLWDITKDYNKNSDNPTDKLVDPLLLSLFYRYFLFEYIFNSSLTNKEIDKEDYFKFFEKENSFNELKPFESLLNIDSIHNFEQIIDRFSSNTKVIFEKAKASWNNMEARFLVEKGITQSQRVVLYGVYAYLKKNENFDTDKFAQWMRVVWNIVENTDIDSWGSAIGVLELIKELETYSDDIYSKFPNSITSASSKNAVEEERIKIRFIKLDPKWEEAFIEAEKHLFFKGSVGFLISSDMSVAEFKHRVQIANLLFNDRGINDKYRTDHILLRALISQYTDFEQIKDRCFTDSDEKEHYLKKMLASDDIVRKALCSWCSLADESSLLQTLNSVTALDSTMSNTSNPFETKMHEELYKNATLQNWMQENGAIRFAHYWQDCYYVYRPKSWYDWILVDSYRDEIINELVKNYNCEQTNLVGSTKYHWGGTLLVKREIQKGTNEYDFVYEFSPNGDLRVGIKESEELRSVIINPIADEYKANGWICRIKYNYKEVKTQCDIQDYVNRIETDVNSLLNKLP
ncbi:MAG: DUF262 domain-containing protein [Bacteroidales bacterium]|nr:DUF262 domain-containing protein [Bacteroidales bacterium]